MRLMVCRECVLNTVNISYYLLSSITMFCCKVSPHSLYLDLKRQSLKLKF